MATLTGANSVILLSATGLFPIPQQMQGFETDDVFSNDAITSVETRMGVDGHMGAGYVAVERKMSITLMADSASNDFFDTLNAAQESAREVYRLDGIVRLPAVGRSFTLVRGFMTSYMPMPDVKKLLGGRKYGLSFEKIIAVPI